MILPTEKLSELCHISSGGTPSRGKTEFYGGDILWAKIRDIEKSNGIIYDTEETITEEGLKNIRNRIFPQGSLLFSMYGSVGKVAFTGNRMSTNQAILGIQLNENGRNKLNLNYLYYWFKINVHILKSKAVGGILKNLSATIVKNFEIPLPSLDDQKRIAKILGDCEALIQKRKDSIDLLNEFVKSTFLEMFGDPRSNSKNWESGPVIDFADCIVPGRDKPKSFSGETPWITTNDLNHLGTTTSSRQNIGLSPSEIKNVRARVIPKNSVLITCVGDLGVASIAGSNMVVNQQLHTFQCKEGMIPTFLMFTLSFQKQYTYKMASKTTVPYMNKTTCNGIPIIKPSKDLQEDFVTIYEKVNSIKTQFISSLKELENLYGSLSQRAFKGELDLSKVDISDMEDSTQVKPKMEPVGDPRWEEKVEVQDYQVHLDEIIKKDFENSTFSFKQLEDAISDRSVYVPYDNVKDFVFKSLEGNESLLVQEMDEKDKQIVFKIRS